jgi:hypothetical protein
MVWQYINHSNPHGIRITSALPGREDEAFKVWEICFNNSKALGAIRKSNINGSSPTVSPVYVVTDPVNCNADWLLRLGSFNLSETSEIDVGLHKHTHIQLG